MKDLPTLVERLDSFDTHVNIRVGRTSDESVETLFNPQTHRGVGSDTTDMEMDRFTADTMNVAQMVQVWSRLDKVEHVALRLPPYTPPPDEEGMQLGEGAHSTRRLVGVRYDIHSDSSSHKLSYT